MTLLNPLEWHGRIYDGAILPGFRVIIEPFATDRLDDAVRNYLSKVKYAPNHISGGTNSIAFCPTCNALLYPVFDFDNRDPQINCLGLWDLERLIIYTCVVCDLRYGPYWTSFGEKTRSYSGKAWTEGAICQIDHPYQQVRLSLVPLEAADFPTSEENHQLLFRGDRMPRVLNQVGGVPYASGYDALECIHCKQPMQFAGIIDSDEIFIYLTENRKRRFFVVGDGDCLHYFTCKPCKTVGVKYVEI